MMIEISSISNAIHDRAYLHHMFVKHSCQGFRGGTAKARFVCKKEQSHGNGRCFIM